MGTLWHLTLEADGRQTLYHTEAELRPAVRALAAVAGAATVLFCIVDDHVHVVVRCDREQAGRLVRSVNLALRPFAEVRIKRHADIRPVENRGHLERLVSYILEQPSHHKLPVHPALWTGSCFLDLIGARAISALGQPLAVFLPRFRLSEAMGFVGLEPRLLTAADDGCLRAAGAARLAAAAGAALALPPGFTGRRKEIVQQRAATAVLAAGAGIATRETAVALGTTKRCIQRLASSAPHKEVLQAIRTRLALEDTVANAVGAGTR